MSARLCDMACIAIAMTRAGPGEMLLKSMARMTLRWIVRHYFPAILHRILSADLTASRLAATFCEERPLLQTVDLGAHTMQKIDVTVRNRPLTRGP